MQLNPRTPVTMVSLERVQDPSVKEVLRNLSKAIDDIYKQTATVLNFNLARSVSQNAAPSLEDGEAVVWVDADAGGGQPKAYIVARVGAVTYTFRSVETV